MASVSHQSVHQTDLRYWQASAEPRLPWWPWGWLALLGLLLLFLIGALVIAPDMQRQTTAAVSQRLSSLGVGVIDAEGDGQRVSVTGISELTDTSALGFSAAASLCSTWAGDLICPTQVLLELSSPTPVAAAAVTPLEAAPVDHRLHDFIAQKTPEGLVLTGEINSDASRRQWLSAARRQFPSVDDQLTVSGELSKQIDFQAQARALQVLSYLQRGSASWSNGQFSVTGSVSQAQRDAAVEAFNSQSPPLNLGELRLNELKPVNQCNEAAANALSGSTVKFATASAAIEASSQALLEQLASISKTCPGQLTIEGHTDSVGSDAANLALSQSRADAVRAALIELGVSAQRMTALGKGESQPVGDNSSPAGRAANRRIVLTFAEPNL